MGGLGPGSLPRSRPGPRQWPGRGQQRQQREPLTPHHSPGRLASITRGSGSSAGYPPSKNPSEPQSRPQTGGAAWGGGRGLGPVGARAGQALPLRAAGGQPAEPAHPRPFSVGRTPFPSLFSLLPPFSPPSPSQETGRPRGPLGRPGLGGSHTGLQSGPWYKVPTGRAECGGHGAGQAVLRVWWHPPRCVVRPACEGCTPLGTG